MSDSKIIKNMISFVLEEEKKAINEKKGIKKKDIVNSIIKELGKEVSNENKKD